MHNAQPDSLITVGFIFCKKISKDIIVTKQKSKFSLSDFLFQNFCCNFFVVKKITTIYLQHFCCKISVVKKNTTISLQQPC